MNGMLARARALLPLALLITLAACGQTEEAEEAAPATETARTVSVARADQVVLPLRGSAPAEVLSPNESELSADVTARVARVHAEVGSTVKAGAPLLELDATDYRLALAQADARVAAAKARVALAERRLGRARALVEQRFVSEDEVLALETEVQSAKAEQQVAEADRGVAARNVEKCRIEAPFDGVVVERFAQVGTLAAAGTPLMRLIDLSPPEVEASVPTQEAGGLSEASDLVFESQGRRYPVRLLRLAPVIERAARTRVARLRFTGDAAPTGSSGTLTWRAPGQRLPAELLVKRGDVLGYFVAQDGRARFVAVPGAQEGRPPAVELMPDALVVVQGHLGLNDGDAIVSREAASGRQGA